MHDVVSTMNHAKRSGIMDDLRLTAPDPNTFLWDIFSSLTLRGWLYLPALILAPALGVGNFIILPGILTVWLGTAGDLFFLEIPLVFALIVTGVVQLALLTAIACYQSGIGINVR